MRIIHRISIVVLLCSRVCGLVGLKGNVSFAFGRRSMKPPSPNYID